MAYNTAEQKAVPSGNEGIVESAKAQTTRIRQWAVIIFLSAVTAQFVLTASTITVGDWAGHFVTMLLDALMIAAIVAFLGETRVFKVFFEERISALFATRFADHASEEKHLRAYSPATLRQIERAVQRASFASEIPADVDPLLDTLSSVRDRLTIWRTDFRQDLRYETLQELEGYYRLHSDSAFRLMNYTRTPQSYDQHISDDTFGCSLPQEDWYKLTRLEVDGTDRLVGMDAIKVSKNGKRTVFSSKIPIELPRSGPGDRGTLLRKTSFAIYPSDEPWVLTFFTPVYRFELMLMHPPNIVPSLYLFGVGGSVENTDPLVPERSERDNHRWRYDGWMLPSHGAVLTFNKLRAEDGLREEGRKPILSSPNPDLTQVAQT